MRSTSAILAASQVEEVGTGMFSLLLFFAPYFACLLFSVFLSSDCPFFPFSSFPSKRHKKTHRADVSLKHNTPIKTFFFFFLVFVVVVIPVSFISGGCQPNFRVAKLLSDT